MRMRAMLAAAVFLAASPALAGDRYDRHSLEHFRDHHWHGAFAGPPTRGELPVAEFYAYYIPRGVLHNGPPPAVARRAHGYRDVIRAKY